MRTVSSVPLAALSPWKRLLRLIQSRPDQNTTLLSVRSLAQVRSEPLSELWFTAAVPATGTVQTQAQHDHNIGPLVRSDGIQIGSSPSGDRKSPDERTIRLGKSQYRSRLLPIVLTVGSATNTLPTPTEYPYNTTTYRNSVAKHFFTSLPVDPSTLACGKRQNTL